MTDFPLARYFSGIKPTASLVEIPALEMLSPLTGRDPVRIIGFAQYYFEAHPLANKLTSTDERLSRLITATLGIGAALISSVVSLAHFSCAARSAPSLSAMHGSCVPTTNLLSQSTPRPSG